MKKIKEKFLTIADTGKWQRTNYLVKVNKVDILN